MKNFRGLSHPEAINSAISLPQPSQDGVVLFHMQFGIFRAMQKKQRLPFDVRFGGAWGALAEHSWGFLQNASYAD